MSRRSSAARIGAQRTTGGVVVVANSSAIGSSSALPDRRLDRRPHPPRSTGHALSEEQQAYRDHERHDRQGDQCLEGQAFLVGNGAADLLFEDPDGFSVGHRRRVGSRGGSRDGPGAGGSAGGTTLPVFSVG